ncbi:MAG: alpha-amylase family protein [bacterium]|jgi:amylosucrase
MYEQVAHSLLNSILNDLRPEIRRQDLRHFYTRLGANFYAIHSLFSVLYGHREDFQQQMLKLVETMASGYIDRSSELERTDMRREFDYNWFLSQQWVGMALYTNGFAQDLADLSNKTSYLQDLGINMMHIMPILKCPAGRSDGGYAVSDFRQIDERVGSMEDFRRVATEFRRRGILLVLDIVLNHTSEEHEWAQRAQAGEQRFQNYYLTFADRDIPDLFERTMPEVFPESSPGNFTWNAAMERWVMTVFHEYQWDLNYANPEVFIQMLDIILFWANEGVDIMRLDAVAFLWKRLGSTCQNERNAHLILQLLKDCCQVTAPGVLFIAEAIVAPEEVAKYFGEDAIVAKECEIAYNATLMALLWDAIATKNTKLLSQGIRSLPAKLERATWLNYVRCHDDIGFGFDDQDIRAVGYDPRCHRRFLADYFTGGFDGQPRGIIFNRDEETGDARICGTLASLVGLETAIEHADPRQIKQAIQRIMLLHGLIFSFGGIPLLFNGDALGTLNDYSYQEDPNKQQDSRWVHRGRLDWERAERRHQPGTVEHTLFSQIQKLIAVRKELPAFADFNNRELLELNNHHLLGLLRSNPQRLCENVIVIANFDTRPHVLDIETLSGHGLNPWGRLVDLRSGKAPIQLDDKMAVGALQFYWLAAT